MWRGGATLRLGPDCSGSATNKLTDPAPSGASSLPHFELHLLRGRISGCRPARYARRGPAPSTVAQQGKCGRCGATIRLPPDCSGSATNKLTDPAPSGASSLPHFELHLLRGRISGCRPARYAWRGTAPSPVAQQAPSHIKKLHFLRGRISGCRPARYAWRGPAPSTVAQQGKCGRELAPDCSGSATNKLTDPAPSGASPLPHFELHLLRGKISGYRPARYARRGPAPSTVAQQGKCGRGLAPDCSGSATNKLTDPAPSGASSLPHFELRLLRGRISGCRPARYAWRGPAPSNVAQQGKCGRGGATIRLAPDCSGSATNKLTDPAPSGASSLPHFELRLLRGRISGCRPARYAWRGPAPSTVAQQGKCGRGLAPDCGGSATNKLTDPAPSGASSLPHFELHLLRGRISGYKPARYARRGRAPSTVAQQGKCGRGLAPSHILSCVYSGGGS